MCCRTHDAHDDISLWLQAASEGMLGRSRLGRFSKQIVHIRVTEVGTVDATGACVRVRSSMTGAASKSPSAVQ